MKRRLAALLIVLLFINTFPISALAETIRRDADAGQTEQTKNPRQTRTYGADAWSGSIATSFARGDGSYQFPYIIETPEQLAYLAKTVNDGNTLKGKYVELTTDLDLADKSWTPIGTNYTFEGNFDGNGYTIAGLTVTNRNRLGLFGLMGGTVSNVKISDAYLSQNTTNGDRIAGILCAETLLNGLIIACNVSGTIEGSGYKYVGGLIGYHGGSLEQCTAKNMNINVRAQDANNELHVGGLVGYAYGTLQLSCAIGAINAQGKAGHFNVGGLIGWKNYGSISQSYATVSISVKAESGAVAAGGLAGSSSEGTVMECYAKGTVYAEGVSNVFAGGLIGGNSSSLYRCYAGGSSVTAKRTQVNNDFSAIAGRLIGNVVTGSASNCWSNQNMQISRTAFVDGGNCDDDTLKEETSSNGTDGSGFAYGGTAPYSLASFKMCNTSEDPMNMLNPWLASGNDVKLYFESNVKLTVRYVLDGKVFNVGYVSVYPNHTAAIQSPAVSGYEPGKASISKIISYDEEETVYYDHKKHAVNFVCKDANGKILTEYTEKKPEGLSYTIAVPKVEGYTPLQEQLDLDAAVTYNYNGDDSAVTATMGTADVTHVVYYDVKTYQVNISFVYQVDGRNVAEPIVTTRRYGEELVFETPLVQGYKIITESLPYLQISDTSLVVPASAACDVNVTIKYDRADARWYTLVVYLPTHGVQKYIPDVEVTFDGQTQKTDINGRVMFSYTPGRTTIPLQIHKDGYYGGKYEEATDYTLKTGLGIDYLEMKVDTSDNPNYSVIGLTCFGNDIQQDYGTINVKYDGYIPIVVKGNVPEGDSITQMILVQEVPSSKAEDKLPVELGGDPEDDGDPDKIVKKVIQTQKVTTDSWNDAFERDDDWKMTGWCVFKPLGTQFSHDKAVEYPIYVYMYTENGSVPIVQELKITTTKLTGEIKIDGLFNETSVDLSGLGIDVFKNMKLDFKFKDNDKLNIPIRLEVQNNEIYIAYDMPDDDFNYACKTYSPMTWEAYKGVTGWTERNEYYLECMGKKLDEKLSKVDASTTASFSLDANLSGGICATIYRGGGVKMQACVKLAVELKAGWTTDFMIVVVPVTLNVTVSLEGEVTLKGLGFDFEKKEIVWPSLELKVGGKLKVSFGLGNRFFSVGVFGQLSFSVTLVIGETTYFDVLALNGKLGVYVKLDVAIFELYYEAAWEFLNKEWPLHSRLKAVPRNERTYTETSLNGDGYLGEYEGMPVYETSAYVLARRNTVEAPEWDAGGTTWEAPALDSDSDVYTAIETAKERVVTVGYQQVAVYFANDSRRNSLDGKTLVYRVYDYGQWSDPCPVDTNLTGDTGFDVLVHNNKLYIAYYEANRAFDFEGYYNEDGTLDNTAIINDITFSQDLSVAVYDLNSKKITSIARITDDENYDSLPSLGVVNGQVYLAWNKNTSHNDDTMFCMNNENYIYYSKLQGNNTWSEPQIVINKCYPVVDLVVAELDSTPYIAMIVDEDGDLYSNTDCAVYVSNLNGNVTHFSPAGRQNSGLYAVSDTYETSKVLWQSGNQIMALDSVYGQPYVFSAEEQPIGEEYKYVRIDDEISALVWANKSVEAEDGSAPTSYLYASYRYRDDDWTPPSVLAEIPYHVMSYDVLDDTYECWIVYTNTYTHVEETSKKTQYFNKLCFLDANYSKSFTHSEDHVETDGNGYVAVTTTVTNTGAYDLKYVKVTLFDTVQNYVDPLLGEYETVTREYEVGEFYVNLKPGQSKTIAVTTYMYPYVTLEDYRLEVKEVVKDVIIGGSSVSGSPGGGSTPSDDVTGTLVGSNTVAGAEALRPDLAINGEYIIIGEAEYLSVRVENLGSVDAEGTLQIWRDGDTESPVHEIELNRLLAKNVKYYLIRLEKDFFVETYEDFRCVVICADDDNSENNEFTIFARKLKDAAGTEKDDMVEVPIFSNHNQTFDLYESEDLTFTITTNEELHFVGAVDERQTWVAVSVEEEGCIHHVTLMKEDLNHLSVGEYEISFIYLTPNGYIDAVLNLNVIDSTPIRLQGMVTLLEKTKDTNEWVYVTSCSRDTALKAEVAEINAERYTCEWIVDGEVVSVGMEYIVGEQYLGKEIYACITAAAPYYDTLVSQTVTLEKVNRTLEAPVIMQESTNETVVVQRMFHVGDDQLLYGFSEVNDASTVTNWQPLNEMVLPKYGIYYVFVMAPGSAVYVATVSNGTLYEVSPLFGDVDGNGRVNNRDLGLLLRYLNGWDIAIDVVVIDMDQNGSLNNRDLGLLQQLLNE